MGLQISIRQSAGVTILDLQGRATIGRGNDLLTSELGRLIDGGAHNLLLNLTGATQVDSSSISTIVRTFVTLKRLGGNLKLLSPRGRVRMALEVLHLLDVIPNSEDEPQALASFG